MIFLYLSIKMITFLINLLFLINCKRLKIIFKIICKKQKPICLKIKQMGHRFVYYHGLINDQNTQFIGAKSP